MLSRYVGQGPCSVRPHRGAGARRDGEMSRDDAGRPASSPAAADAGASMGAGREAALEMAEAADTGGRQPAGRVAALIAAIAFAWSAFQLWIASPFPYTFAGFLPIPNDTDTRSIHLATALFLTFLGYPLSRRALAAAPHRIPAYDWALGALGAGAALYLTVFADSLALRPGLPITADLVVAATGIVIVLEAARRALGPPLMVIALVFLGYVFFGHLAPEVIAWKGASFSKSMSHMWITQEGVFGVALGVSTTLIFLFVLFGALLERAGAGNYFIWVAFALLGHFRGGPAKAAVVSSAMTGIISGSSTANVVTTGTFTIPLMKRVGLPAEKAGAVEVASSTNGQLTPPIMGAAAFLMIEFVGIEYVEVIKHAFLPAVISYAALVYIVHLEACKAGFEGLPRRTVRPWHLSLLRIAATLAGIVVLSGVVYYGLGWIKEAFGGAAVYVATALLLAAYLALVRVASRFPDLPPSSEIRALPEVAPVVLSGLYFVLPVVVLVWCLTVERFSPGLSVFWACAFMIVVLLTHKPLKDLMRRGKGRSGADADTAFPAGEPPASTAERLRESVGDFTDGMIAGARNMVSIAVATAAAGIIIGTVTLTGIGLVMAEFVELISLGNVLLMLVFTAAISLILGMGLPTTANYIVVSSLMAPVIVSVGADNGLIVPLIAVHLFVFYFGILADDTPPVGIAAYAASAISGGDPIRTGLQGFAYDVRTAILPFMFIFNTELLLIDVGSWPHLFAVIASASAAMLLFAAATQGWFVTRSRRWESAALLLIAFTLFRPGFWMDFAAPPLEHLPAGRVFAAAEAAPDKGQLRVRVKGETLEGDPVDKVVVLPLGPAGADGAERLREAAGLELRDEGGRLFIDRLDFGGAAEKQKLDFDWEVAEVLRKSDRPAKHWMYLPALVLLALVVALQRRRRARGARTGT